MYTKVKIIRTYWGDTQKLKREIPPQPIYTNQIVFVWGEENNQFLKKRGFDTILMSDEIPNEYNSYEGQFYRKLLALDLSLKMFGEVILLDWDCYILRELDDNFYNYLKEKPTQCPLYGQYKNVKYSWVEATPPKNKDEEKWVDVCESKFIKYSWKLDSILVSPNFGFVYSRDIELGKKLIEISNNNKLDGCIEEHAMFIYADCSLEEYIEKYHPFFIKGVCTDYKSDNFLSTQSQKYFNSYIDDFIEFDTYLHHI